MTAPVEPLVLPNLPPLPPGWAPNEPPYTASEPTPTTTAEPPPRVDWELPEPETPRPAPPQSGVLDVVTGASGHPVSLHRAEYRAPSLAGEPTDHGYAWVCRNTACRRVTLGYPSDGYTRALDDAEGHDCTAVRHG